MEANRHLAINVTPFEGDPHKFNFFNEQLLSVIKLNKLNDEEALLLAKSKLTGAALQYYIESPILQNIKKVDELLCTLKKFFIPHVNSNAVQDLKNITMLPNENIQSLAHRISRLTYEVYPQLTHAESLQQLMMVSLLNAIPNSIKVKIVENKCKSFDEAINLAETLFETYTRHNILNYLIDTPSNSLNTQVNQLQAEVNFLKTNVNRNNESENLGKQKVNSEVSSHKPSSWKSRESNFRAVRKQQNDSHNFKPKVSCHYCLKAGHIKRFCRKLKRDNLLNSNHRHHQNMQINSNHCCTSHKTHDPQRSHQAPNQYSRHNTSPNDRHSSNHSNCTRHPNH